ncbi:MAG: nonspecific lipid-transfer protein, partial [Mycobacterium sp.]
MSCAVVGIGRTEYSRNSGRTTRGMAVAACRDAIADAGLTPADVDGICTFM